MHGYIYKLILSLRLMRLFYESFDTWSNSYRRRLKNLYHYGIILLENIFPTFIYMRNDIYIKLQKVSIVDSVERGR